MALIYSGQKCSTCGEVLIEGAEIVATTHFLGPEDPLWRYSDSVMHQACYERWEHREEFAAKYRKAMGREPGAGSYPRKKAKGEGLK